LLRRKDYPDGRFTLAFVGYGDESDHAVIELTHNWDTKSTTWHGFGHLAVSVADAREGRAAVKAQGGRSRARRPDEIRRQRTRSSRTRRLQDRVHSEGAWLRGFLCAPAHGKAQPWA
jgi:lactoylglutathione lyase